MNRKFWLAAAGWLSLVVLALCLFAAFLAWNSWQGRQGTAGHRESLRGFGYCSARPLRPCIVSFSLNPEGGMVIHVLTDSPNDFSIKIKHEGGESLYECKRVRQQAADVDCLGETMPVGKTLSFVLLSKDEKSALAEGSFPIIGLALATPDVYFTPTPILFDHSPR